MPKKPNPNKRVSSDTRGARIWSYGVLFPREREVNDAIRSLLHQANRYQNCQVVIERVRRQRYRVIRSAASPELARLEQEYKDLGLAIDAEVDTMRAQRASVRRRTTDPVIAAKIKALKAKRAAVNIELKIAREKANAILRPIQDAYNRHRKPGGVKAAPRTAEKLNAAARQTTLEEDWPELAKQLLRLEDWATRRVKQAREASGLPPGTYLLVDQAIAATKKEPTDPRPKRFDGTGRIGVQLFDFTPQTLFSRERKQLQIDPLPATQWDTRPGRRKARTELRIDFGGNAFEMKAAFKMILHRPLPQDASIKWAWIHVTRIGSRLHYSLQLTMRSDTFQLKPGGQGVVAVNLGWRIKEDGAMRVAYVMDEFGTERELAMPPELRGGFVLAENLRSYSDQHFNVAKKAIGEFVKTDAAPAWLKEQCTSMHAWQRHGRLLRIARMLAIAEFPDTVLPSGERVRNGMLSELWKRWKEHRLAAVPKLDLFDTYQVITDWARARGATDLKAATLYLWVWKKKNDHLYNWECGLRAHKQKCRKQLYRAWATELATTYSTILVEKFDLRDTREKSAPEAEQEENPTSLIRSQNFAAPSELRDAIVAAAGTGRVKEQKSHNNTVTCHECGHTSDRDRRFEALIQVCESCGVVKDQDKNNCENQLSRYFSGESPGGGLDPESARNHENSSDLKTDRDAAE